MSIIDSIHCRLANTDETEFSGESLVQSLYTLPIDLLLTGELGAGKTTLLRGLAHGMGIRDPIVSPTFALEQRYHTKDNTPFLHIDLYRLTPQQAGTLIDSTDDHEGIRCIEWPDRLMTLPNTPRIQLHLSEEDRGRDLSVQFEDITLPSEEEILRWYAEVQLPPHIIAHCETVARVCDALSTNLLQRGRIIRPLLLKTSARLHDLLRFIDFSPLTQSEEESTVPPEVRTLWTTLRQQYAGNHHEEACAEFLRSRGYNAVASVIAGHGALASNTARTTIEQQLLYYADKRAALDSIVTVEQRIREFFKRHGKSAKPIGETMFQEAMAIEHRYFPDGTPI